MIRKIATIVGSESDLPQCIIGIEYLLKAEEENKAKLLFFDVASQHRHTNRVQDILSEYSLKDFEANKKSGLNILITGAGWANHLSGCCDAFLRYCLLNDSIIVIGVAFEDQKNHLNTMAAQLSISQVPGTQMIFKDSSGEQFTGASGFYRACVFAVEGDLPEIKLKKAPPCKRMSFSEALKEGAKKP